jgi:hypothetical protein
VTRAEHALMIAEAIKLFEAGAPWTIIAKKFDRTVGTIQRWMNRRNIKPPDEATQTAWIIEHLKPHALALHARAASVEQAASIAEVPTHAMRAAIYLALQDQKKGTTNVEVAGEAGE